jgi:hypothetical protein
MSDTRERIEARRKWLCAALADQPELRDELLTDYDAWERTERVVEAAKEYIDVLEHPNDYNALRLAQVQHKYRAALHEPEEKP